MADAKPASTGKGNYGILLFLIIFHIIEIVLFRRYDRVDFSWTSFPIWSIVTIVYLFVGKIIAKEQGLPFKQVLPYVIAQILWPLWNIVPLVFPQAKIIVGMIMIMAPVLIIYYLTEFPKTTLVYVFVWTGVLFMTYMGPIQAYASSQNLQIAGVAPGLVAEYYWTKAVEYTKFTYISLQQSAEKIPTYATKIATGEYDPFAAQVADESKEKLGVSITSVLPTQKEFRATTKKDQLAETDPLTKIFPKEGTAFAITTVTSKVTVNTPMPTTIRLTCTSEKRNGIMSPESFPVKNKEEKLATCKTIQKPGMYPVKITANFDFNTLAYIRQYFVSEKIQEEAYMKGQDLMATQPIPERQPTPKYTEGPARVTLQISGLSPVAMSDGENNYEIYLTISPGWDGKLMKIKKSYLILPFAFEATEISAPIELTKLTKNDCKIIPAIPCTGNVYELPTYESSTDTDLGATTYVIKVKTTSQALETGKKYGTITEHLFKAVMNYEYSVDQSTIVQVAAVQTVAST